MYKDNFIKLKFTDLHTNRPIAGDLKVFIRRNFVQHFSDCIGKINAFRLGQYNSLVEFL